MKIGLEPAGPCRHRLTLEIPAETIGAAYEAAVDAYARSASVPGFRKGRTPREVVRRRFAKAILSDVRDEVVPRAYREACREKGLHVLAILDVQQPDLAPDRAATVSITVETAPEFDLPDYRSYAIQAPVEPVADEQVGEMFESLRRRHATYEDVGDGPARPNDLVQVDFSGTIDGRPLDEVEPGARGLGKASGAWIPLDGDAVLPGFAAGLEGATIGESRKLESVFPDSFTVKGLAGKTALFDIQVKAVRRPVLPEVNTDFLSRFGAGSESELRTRIRSELESARDARREEFIRGEILRRLLAETRIEELPETQVRHETQEAIYGLVRRTASRGVPQEAILEQKDRIFENASRGARESVAIRHILRRVADAEQVRVSDAELDAYLQAEAQRSGEPVDALRKRTEKAGATEEIRQTLRRHAAMNRIREQVTVNE